MLLSRGSHAVALLGHVAMCLSESTMFDKSTGAPTPGLLEAHARLRHAWQKLKCACAGLWHACIIMMRGQARPH
ncbi:hypothetical protein PanWU01x14_178360 [Parasponia andersonii]|uniref:Secreted protein n=1 Tax=Parasponia andersonii TaxID=3476 RepID=A0A2P5C784_PARAD|nr:hypothetical protein PanWU01x14_178360 [Parasponia andersonii]